MLASEAAVSLKETSSKARLGIITPQPFPDEIARGLKGRLMRLNGLVCEETTNRILDRIYRTADSENQTRRLPIETLAFAVGMDRKRFVCQHTMLPYKRWIADVAWDHPHGSDADPGWRVPVVLQSERSAAFLCRNCVAEDLSFHGVSFWRREHQLPGRWWCGKHETALHFVEGRDPFLASPAASLGSASQPDVGLVAEWRGNACIQRFVHLQSEVIQRKQPLSARAVQRLLQRLCRQHDVAYGDAENKRHLSASLRHAFGDEWFRTIDRSSRQTTTQNAPSIKLKDAPSCTMALASLAVLASDAEDAFKQLISEGRTAPSKQREAPRRLDGEILRRLYIKHRGVHNKISDEMHLFPASVKYRLDRMGLPTLTGANLVQLQRDLCAFAEEQMSLETACERSPERQAALAATLRCTAKNLLLATKFMKLDAHASSD